MKVSPQESFKDSRDCNWNIFLDVNIKAMPMYPRIFSTKTKIAWNREFTDTDKTVKISFTKC